MKKLFTLAVAMLFVAPFAKATDFWVKNNTGKAIALAIKGHPVYRDSLNAYILEPKKKVKFFTVERLEGPLRFAFVEDMKKDKYPFYETTGLIYEAAGKKKENSIFPVPKAAIRAVSIQMTTQKDENGVAVPGIKKTFPPRGAFGKWPVVAFDVLTATPKKSSTGEMVLW